MATASTIPEQLLAALKRSGWSVPDLLEKSGLATDRTGLWRKLHGKQRLSFEEAGALAETFRKHAVPCTLVWPKKTRRAA